MQENKYIIKYSSNNSGGNWWLEDKDWFALEKAGWIVDWVKESKYTKKFLNKDGRYLGSLATSATRTGLTMKMAICEWEEVTKQSSQEEGCACCGPPHDFYEIEYDTTQSKIKEKKSSKKSRLDFEND